MIRRRMTSEERSMLARRMQAERTAEERRDATARGRAESLRRRAIAKRASIEVELEQRSREGRG